MFTLDKPVDALMFIAHIARDTQTSVVLLFLNISIVHNFQQKPSPHRLRNCFELDWMQTGCKASPTVHIMMVLPLVCPP